MDTKLLNEGQKKAADGFFAFLLSTEKELIISGPGGVGKTYLMSYLIDKVMPQYHETCQIMGVPIMYQNVVMTATTNKAAAVLSEATSRTCDTIFKFMNLTVRDDYSTGKTSIVRSRSWTMKSNTVIFIDEASMIDTALLNELRTGTLNCKLVYVGDNRQLGPVLEKISPIYKKVSMPFFELTEPVRNAGQPALLHVCQQLRDTVQSDEFEPIQIVPGVIDYATDDDMPQLLEQYFKAQGHASRILAYTNNRVEDYNNYIRDNLRSLGTDYQVGEYLVNNNPVQFKTTMLSVEEEVEMVGMLEHTRIDIVDEDDQSTLEVRLCDLQSEYGLYKDVPVPVDKKHYQELLKYYKAKKKWLTYFKLKNTYPDLRPRDSATIHKAQGSTYDTVFIDLTDLSYKCHRPDIVARLLYVGFTRAKNRVILYGELDEKYGGLLA